MGRFRNKDAGRGDHIVPNRRVAVGERLCAMVACPRLDWPVDLFANNRNVAFMPLEQRKSEFLCACGCQQRHNCAVSRVVAVNGDPRVFWYRTIRCFNKHAGIPA
jgi:hypothetical protein